VKALLHIRNVCGALLLAGFFITGSSVAKGGGGLGGALLAMAMLVAAACFFSRSLAGLCAWPLTHFIDGIYFGSNPRDLPPVNLRLPQGFRQQRRFRDAMEECERQLEYHPRSLDLWVERIRAATELGAGDEARALCRKARKRLRHGDREELSREFPFAEE
jgi:hypothetical protein